MRKFRCKKTLEMHQATLYEKGGVYEAHDIEVNGDINIPNLLGKSHNWSTRMSYFDEYFEEIKEITAPAHYDNSKGSLYKVASERNWNPYLFDVVKRLERGGKKDPLRQEIEKSIFVLQLWLEEEC